MSDLPPKLVQIQRSPYFSVINRRMPRVSLHRITTTDTPMKFRTNGVDAIGFRVYGILAFLNCNPEAIILATLI